MPDFIHAYHSASPAWWKRPICLLFDHDWSKVIGFDVCTRCGRVESVSRRELTNDDRWSS